MRTLYFSTVLVVALTSAVCADVLVLRDGRTFTGTVTLDGTMVIIQVPHGTLQFPSHEVQRIERMDTPEQELEKRLSHLDPLDADALYHVAQWALENALPRQADQLHQRVLSLDGDHPGARRSQRFVRIDGRWQSFEQGLRAARGKLENDEHREVLTTVLPALAAIATAEQQPAWQTLAAEAHLRGGNFNQARRAYEALAARARGDQAIRFQAIAQILQDHPDGMYLLSEDYPPTMGLLDSGEEYIQAGPASLSRPLAMQAALRDLAREQVVAARGLVEQARGMEATDPEGARAHYNRALQFFDRADAMVPEISRSYRVEIARRRISTIRRDVQGDATRFDAEVQQLGEQNLSAGEYRDKVMRLSHSLNGVRRGLDEILDLATPFERELVMEIRWAQGDIQRIEAMQRVLRNEVNGQR